MNWKSVICILFVALLAGCARDQSSNIYARNEAMKMQVIKEGSIVSLEPVIIQGSKTVGSLAGGATGAIAAGSHIGGGSGSSIAAIGGALLGGWLGDEIEERMTRKQGVNISIRLVSGELISVVQAIEPGVVFHVGERVRVYQQPNGKSRVVRQ